VKLKRESKPRWVIILGSVAALLLAFAAILYSQFRDTAAQFVRLREYRQDPAAHSDWAMRVGEPCGDAPFLQPTDGYLAFSWGARYRGGRRHQGLDIFGPDGIGETAVVAVHDGYLTRLPHWLSAVIIRLPEDPLNPGRSIWTYYAHMADEAGESFIVDDFPPGTEEKFVAAGTLLGFQGNYSGDLTRPTGLHLHFSIVEDDDEGSFKNELEFGNTIDPSPYLGFEVSADDLRDGIARCDQDGTL
jgi:murein DD-endopeptidase MepM/ murein hydrolase activator NlpD